MTSCIIHTTFPYDKQIIVDARYHDYENSILQDDNIRSLSYWMSPMTTTTTTTLHHRTRPRLLAHNITQQFYDHSTVMDTNRHRLTIHCGRSSRRTVIYIIVSPASFRRLYDFRFPPLSLVITGPSTGRGDRSPLNSSLIIL